MLDEILYDQNTIIRSITRWLFVAFTVDENHKKYEKYKNVVDHALLWMKGFYHLSIHLSLLSILENIFVLAWIFLFVSGI